MTLLIHGHKPDKLGGWTVPPSISFSIKQVISEHLKKEKPNEVVLGLDLGVPQWAAEVCVELGIPYTAYIPFIDFSNKWPPHSRKKYAELASAAKMVVVVTKGPYAPGVYYRRNDVMVSLSSKAAIVWDGSDGVTNHIRARADYLKLPVCNLYNLFSVDLKKSIEVSNKMLEKHPQPKPKQISTSSASASVKAIVAKTAKYTKTDSISPEQEEEESTIEVLAPKRYIEID